MDEPRRRFRHNVSGCRVTETAQERENRTVNTQLKKGVLDLLVLALLDSRDRYGFELVERISKRIDIAERTVYPLLKRLRDEEMVASYLQESNKGPPRKYYCLTDKGRTTLAGLKSEWFAMNAAVNQLLEEEERNDAE